MQLDLRVSQAFELADTELSVYLEVQNVTNRKNTEELVYSPDFVRRGEIQSLPILPDRRSAMDLLSIRDVVVAALLARRWAACPIWTSTSPPCARRVCWRSSPSRPRPSPSTT